MPRPGPWGRPGSRVFPLGWEQHHRPVAINAMTAVCEISADGIGPGAWNSDRGEYDPPPRIILHAAVPCRVQQLRQPREAPVGDQEVTTHDYLIPVPATIGDVEVGHQVKITGYTDPTGGDPSLIGRPLTITDIQRGSVIWERDLGCIDNLG